MPDPALVLVVDDDPSVVLLVRTVMEQEGLAVVSAGTCDEALAQAARHAPQVVLLDLHLPDGSGTEVLRTLQRQESTSRTPVVVMSGSSGRDLVVELLDAGAHDYLTKPVDVGELVARTRAALRVQRAYTALYEQARTDALTELPNRRALDEAVRVWRSHAERSGEALSVAMLDVVAFKSVNDTFGHDTGDIVLRGIADVLRRGRRVSDVVGRWGGDEFLAILPGAGAEEAAGVVARLQGAVRDEVPVPVGRVELRAGIAQHCPGSSVEELLRAAAQDLHERHLQT